MTRVDDVAAELGGTALLVALGLSAEAQVTTAVDGVYGGQPTIAAAWGLAVLVACYAVGRFSGAHINPAVTVALAIKGDFPWSRVGPYIIAQMLGGFLGALLARVVTWPLIQRFDPGLTLRSQGVFSTLPGVDVPRAFALLNESLGTFVLVMTLFVLLDHAHQSQQMAHLEPALIGAAVTMIGITLGSVSGWAINPARDLPPRLMQAFTGYADPWTDQTGALYWWVPVLGPLLGASVAALTYRIPALVRAVTVKRDIHAEPDLGWPPPGLRPPPEPVTVDATTRRRVPRWIGSPDAELLARLIPPGCSPEQARLIEHAFVAGRTPAQGIPAQRRQETFPPANRSVSS